MPLQTLVELDRGNTLECQHFGAIAVVNRRGELLAHAGDAHWLTFSRSTLKPFQALPFMQAGGPAHFGFGAEQIAMLCASHNGERQHVAQVQSMLEKAGLTYKALQCGCHAPLFIELGLDAGTPPYDERHHNCSGKHAGFLAYCVQHGLPQDAYNHPEHPLQQAIRRDLAWAVELPQDSLKMGIDGCSAPNYALPLAHLAFAYARLASGLQDSRFGPSYARLGEAMTTWPELVSGTARNDLAFMRAGRGDWITKVGADGVQAIASKSRGEAFAIKIVDGNKTALFAACIETLQQLGWLDEQQKTELEPWRAEALLNARGAQVGRRRSVFKLVSALAKHKLRA